MKKFIKFPTLLLSVMIAFSSLSFSVPTFAETGAEDTEVQTLAEEITTSDDSEVQSAAEEGTIVDGSEAQTDSDEDTELKNPEESLGSYAENNSSTEDTKYELHEVDPEGPVYEGTVSQEATDQANELMDYIANSSPASSDEVLGILSSSSNGLLTMEDNALDLVTVQESTTLQGKTGYIYVVDSNAAVFLVQDNNGNYIAGATVTISYLDDNGTRVTRSIRTSGGGAPGIASFNDMEGTRYGVVDVTAEGYHSVTFLEEEITGGNKRTFTLTKNASDNELYIRCADFDGKDLIYSDTEINLFNNNTDRMDFKILVSKAGNAQLPGTVYLRSKTDNRTIAAFTSYRSYDENTYIFTYTDCWVNRNGNLLKDGDELVLDFGSESFALSNVTVQNAVTDPSFVLEQTLPIAGGDGSDSDSAIPFEGVDRAKVALSLLQLKVSAAIFPDGTFFIMAMKDIEGSKKGFDELMPKTTSPKTAEQMKGVVDLIAKAYKKATSDLEQSRGTLQSQAEICHAYTSGTFVCSYGVMFTGTFDKDAGEFSGDFDFIFQVNAKYSDTIYCLVEAGPVVIPFYFGFEVGLAGKADVDVGFTTKSIFGPYSWSKKTGNVAFHLLPTVVAFLGVGIRGIAGVDLQTNIDFDLAYYPYNRDGEIGAIDAHADFRLNYYYLFSSGSYTFLSSGKQRIFPKSNSLTNEENTAELTDIDLDLTEEQIVNQISLTENDDGSVTLPSYYMSSLLNLTESTVNGTQTVNQITTNSYIDNQLQLIGTDDYVAMFRLISKDGKTRLVYQVQSEYTGVISNQLYEVQVPDDQSVIEYYAIAAKYAYRGNRANFVFIAAVCADESIEDMDERAASTSVCGITIDLLDNTERYCETLAPADGTYHFNPKPAGNWAQCIVAYSSSPSYQDKTNYTSYMVTADGDIAEIGEKTQFYSTGQILDEETPSFWYVNQDASDENTVKLEGMNLNGTVSDSWTCHADLDVSGYDLDDGENYITAWWYQGTVDYLIAMGKVYYLEKYNTDPSAPEGTFNAMRATELTYSDGQSAKLGSSEGTYQFFSSRQRSAIFIACAAPVYTVTNEETLETECTGTRVEVYYISYDISGTTDKVNMHESRTLYLEDKEMTSFSCAFTAKTRGSGIVAVYNESPDGTYNDIYEFQENASEGMIITDFNIQDPVVTNTQEWIAADVTLKNVGYTVSGLVGFKITDGTGTVLTEGIYDERDGSIEPRSSGYYHWFDYIYPNDTATHTLYFRTNPDWKTDTEQSITITIVINGADENTVYTTSEALNSAYANGGEYETYSTSFTLQFDEPYLELSGNQNIVNDRHVAEISIENSSVIQADNVRVALVGVYSGIDSSYDKDADLTLVDECLGTVRTTRSGILNRNVEAGRYTAQSYNMDIDLESIWADNKTSDLRGINLYLVDESGININDQVVYMDNPYYHAGEDNKEPESETPAGTNPETTANSESKTNLQNTSASGNSSSNVKTGDINYTAIWVFLIICAAAAFAGIIIWRRKSAK